MKKLFLCIAMILLLLMAAAKDEPSVPSLRVISDRGEMEALICGYQLAHKNSLFQKKNVVSDCVEVDEVAKPLEGLMVSPGEPIDFEFDQGMDQFFILDWHQEMNFDEEGCMIAPDEAGTYLYVVTAYWGENEATYVIKVMVQ